MNQKVSSLAGFESPAVSSAELALGQCLSGTQALFGGTVNSLMPTASSQTWQLPVPATSRSPVAQQRRRRRTTPAPTTAW